ncbi:MAG TPA: efflux RND transporter periplasmic adaptor subunit [Steroidobacteraceae bacterium]|nr:efflux RND transporter periplasmic adaptor subunit [Steroidobacteraceae bacterium]
MQPSEVPDDTSLTESGGVSTEFEPETGRRVKKGAIIAAAVLGAAFIVVLALRFFEQRAVAAAGESAYSAAPGVDVVTAKAPGAGQDLVLPAQTAAWYETTIYARVNGYVAKWLVDIGDHVKKGQSLAVIETPELDAELAAARASLRASEAQVTARQAEAEFSRTTNERWRDSPKGVVSDQEREAKKADYESARARLYAAQAQVALDRSHVEQYSALAEFKQVSAPFDGTITERKIDVGNLVTAGSSSTTTPLYRISQTDPLRIFVDVPQAAAADLMKPGIPAQIRAPGSAGGVFSGKVARAAEALNAQARTMRVEIDMPNADHALVPGMYVNVAFRLEPRGSVEIPAAALIFRPTGTFVAKVDARSRVDFANVTIARDDGNLVELASGVSPGDRLVLNISSQIAPGQTVAVNEGPAP